MALLEGAGGERRGGGHPEANDRRGAKQVLTPKSRYPLVFTKNLSFVVVRGIFIP